MIPKSLLALLGAAVVTLAAPQAAAQSGSNGWDFSIAPYLVAAGMDGSLTVKGIEADIDVPFSDIIDNLDFAAMVHFDMRNEHWVLMSDLFYVDLEGSDDVALGTATAAVQQTLFEVAGGYRVSPVGTLLAGARWVDLDTRIRYAGQILDEEVSAGKSWIDPFVGVHLMAPLSRALVVRCPRRHRRFRRWLGFGLAGVCRHRFPRLEGGFNHSGISRHRHGL